MTNKTNVHDQYEAIRKTLVSGGSSALMLRDAQTNYLIRRMEECLEETYSTCYSKKMLPAGEIESFEDAVLSYERAIDREAERQANSNL